MSPALAWNPAPVGTAELLLVIQDADVPLPFPSSHGAALLDPTVTMPPIAGLNPGTVSAGVHMLRVGTTSGYNGPRPLPGHGPHRYAIQLFALAEAIPSGERRRLGSAVGAVGHVLARGRIDGFAKRT
ncbi:hypothetical protein [Nocardia sp. NPDC050710]|uniref:YbhB/YbcL family Raf kinase inhibitor-like protein n=1 Tax=Nocardia sp. NPDC050710 TaxID=3157220 RepID=UPI0034003698